MTGPRAKRAPTVRQPPVPEPPGMHHSARPPLARIMITDQAVREGTWPNATSLAERLEVDPRTVRRDIMYMRDQLGAPLEYDPAHRGYYYTEPNFRLSYFPVTEGELVALMLARRLLKQYRGTPFEHDLRRAFDKLARLLPDGVTVRLDAAADCLTVLPPVETDYDPATFAVLARSVVERHRVEVVYHTAGRDAVTARTLEPYNLLLRGDDWFVIARDSYRGEVRVFSIQRFRSVRDIGEAFDRPADFRVEDYIGDSFRMVRGEGHHRVALKFQPPAAGWVAEKRWHRTQVIEPTPDGGLILRMEISDLREIVRWGLYWGSSCAVLEPEALKSLIADECRAILDGKSLMQIPPEE
jgi:predicted DNA-binding transcriptional regulator YafY